MVTPEQERPQDVAPGGRLRLFMSYARADAAAVRTVEEGLENLHYQLWVDHKLDGGQAWWNEILERIRQSDAMIAAVSPSLLESEAATLERSYASALGKPLLPVLVAPLLTDLLPVDLAPLQLIDYTTASPANAFRLAGALASLPLAPPLPDPLPAPPAVPLSYMNRLADRIRAQRLGLDEQLVLVASLRAAIDRPREHDAALQLLIQLSERRDLYHQVWLDMRTLLPPAKPAQPRDIARDDGPSARGGEAPRSEQRTQSSRVPAGWYADPSHRHQSRWFDGDWTKFAADGGRVVEDPDF